MNIDRQNEGPLEHTVLGLCEETPIVVMDQGPGNADSQVSFDMHYELEMGVVLTGTMERYVGDMKQTCEAGDMWFCGMWEPHGYRADELCHRIVVAIWPPLLTGLRFPEARDINWMAPFTATPAGRPSVPSNLRGELIALVEHYTNNGTALSATRKRLMTMDLLLFLFEHDLVGPSDSVPAPAPEQMVRIVPAIDLAFEKRDLVTNVEAANACRLSRDVFIRSFRRLMGVSFSKFALRHRLSRAAAQLARTDIPIKAIASEWGFTDASHLHRLFSRHYGCSPLLYRTSQQ